MKIDHTIFYNDNVQEYECSICKCISYPPYTTDCSHIFCQDCINNWFENNNSCPNCLKLNPRIEKNAFVERILNYRKVRCPNRCGYKGTLIDFFKFTNLFVHLK